MHDPHGTAGVSMGWPVQWLAARQKPKPEERRSTMSKILVASAVAIMVASAGAASAKVRHHSYRHAAPNAQIGQPGGYGSPGNLTPGYSSTARTPPTNTNGQ
jgi:hypothetical protein